MESKDFQKYIRILQEKPFRIYPPPKGPDQTTLWHSKYFAYIDDSKTHVTIQDTDSEKRYVVPLALVEFANPGVLRLAREVSPWNGSFV